MVGVMVGVMVMVPGAGVAAAPRFDEPGPIRSANGAALLGWDQDLPIGALEYELQEGDDPDLSAPQVRYRGSYPSFFVSGRRDGSRYFRVRSRRYADPPGPPGPWSEWSATQELVVEHHDLGLALGLFGAGAAVFVITSLTLVAGARREARNARRSTP